MRYSTVLNISVLIFSLLLGGSLAIWMGKELCWDLASYHFYNPYAYLHHRDTMDYWPNSFVHHYISPSMDFLGYYLIRAYSPIHSVFLLGAIHGLNLWLMFLLARFFTHNNYISFCIACISLFGPTALPGVGSFQNDNLVSLFVLGSVLFQARALREYTLCAALQWRGTVLAGVLLGMALGLKLTSGVFVLGTLVALLLLPLPWRIRLYWILFCALGSGIGLAMTSGYWMLHMWQMHHNPVFPFFNQIFQSPDFTDSNWFDTRYLPHGFWQAIAFPFYFAWDGRIADGEFHDIRLLMVYILFILAGIGRLFLPRGVLNLPRNWLFGFVIISYIAWEYLFSIGRYIVVLEMLAPLLIYLLLEMIVTAKESRFAYFILIAFMIMLFMVPASMVRSQDYTGSFFNVKLPAVVQHTPASTVLVSYSVYALYLEPRPQNYLLPYFPREWNFIGIPFALKQLFLNERTRGSIAMRLPKDRPIFLLGSDFNMPSLYAAAATFNLQKSGPCEKIYSDRQEICNQDVLLCPVKASM